MCPLEGKVAVVAGATRGAGRGIASMLGEAGATVYCTGRSVRGEPATPGRSETIDQTADTVTANGQAHARSPAADGSACITMPSCCPTARRSVAFSATSSR